MIMQFIEHIQPSTGLLNKFILKTLTFLKNIFNSKQSV